MALLIVGLNDQYNAGESLNISYLSPYLKAVGSNYSNGVNFAIGGSMTLPRDVLFSLHVQVQQFFFFKARSMELINQGLFVVCLFRSCAYTNLARIIQTTK
jgi:hypothetical protein